MKTNPKFYLTSKGISYFLMLVLVLLCTACGDDDEPNYNDEERPELTTGVSPSILPGTWLVESVTHIHTGEVIPVNKEFTILPFNVNQTSPYEIKKYGDGSEEWGEPYFTFTSFSSDFGTLYGEGGINYYRAKGKKLEDSIVITVMLNFPNETNSGSYGLFLNDMEYSNGVLIAKNGGFNFEAGKYSDEDFAYIGLVTMKKK